MFLMPGSFYHAVVNSTQMVQLWKSLMSRKPTRESVDEKDMGRKMEDPMGSDRKMTALILRRR